MPFEEVVEAEGHLIDSHVMEQIFDKVVESNGRFEVEQFRIGRTNGEASYLRLRLETATRQQMEHLLAQILPVGCSPVEGGDATLKLVERDRCAPEDFYSTSNHHTFVRIAGQWMEVRNQRMDAMIVVKGDDAWCSRLRDLKAGDMVVTGMHGIRVAPESKERDRLSFAFMSNEISSERQVETAVRQTVALARQAKDQGKTIVAVAGPVVVHTGGVAGLSKLIRHRWIDALLTGNALGVHDIEASLLGTSLGVRLEDGRQAEHGHRNHMRAINVINHEGGIRGAVESGRLKSGIMYECVRNNVPFVLAGSLRDDGPLPDTITDMNEAQDAYAALLKTAGLVICLGSMLHSIATGNMLPSWVKIVCVDINPAVATKVSDRGSGQAVGVVTDVGLFLELLSRELEERA
ncbi:MAG: TIGR00300 family protein [Acidobacteriota bacterium]|nr:TIGR00300 family protein [Acidobacteriota bacterium]